MVTLRDWLAQPEHDGKILGVRRAIQDGRVALVQTMWSCLPPNGDILIAEGVVQHTDCLQQLSVPGEEITCDGVVFFCRTTMGKIKTRCMLADRVGKRVRVIYRQGQLIVEVCEEA